MAVAIEPGFIITSCVICNRGLSGRNVRCSMKEGEDESRRGRWRRNKGKRVIVKSVEDESPVNIVGKGNDSVVTGGGGRNIRDGEVGRKEKEGGVWWGWMWGVVEWMFGGKDQEGRLVESGGGEKDGIVLEKDDGNLEKDYESLVKTVEMTESNGRGKVEDEKVTVANKVDGEEEDKEEYIGGFFGFGRRRRRSKKQENKKENFVYITYGDLREDLVYNMIRQAVKRRARVSKSVRDELATVLPYDLQRSLFDAMITPGNGKHNKGSKGKTKRIKKGNNEEGKVVKDKNEEEVRGRERENGDTPADQSSEILLQLRKDIEQSDEDDRREAIRVKEQEKKQKQQKSEKESKGKKNGGLWSVPGRVVGALLHVVGFADETEEGASEDEQNTESRATSRRAAAYAVALSREIESTNEADLSRGAASAFAAASVIASSASKTEREAAEVAGLNASVSAARAVRNIEDATVFIETVGVGPLVSAARVLRGANHSAALTALANLAIILPSSRSKILRADGSSVGQSIVQAVERSIGFRIVPNENPLWHMEALVSGVHLLGSLALSVGTIGTRWRRKMALDESLVQNLKKLADGLKPGEPEGAARAARRALGALGINEWKPRVPGQRGLRILSIDGGGTRAIMSFEMLKELKKLTGCEIHELFDVIGGTSTGAIVAASLGLAHKSVEEVELLYRDLIGKVFARHPVNGPKLLLTRAFYDTSVLEETLKRECGRGVFMDSVAEENMNKVFVVSSIMSKSPQELHLFRNYTYPLGHESRYEGTGEAQMWEALRASSAAPTFFSEIRINDELHADGAIVANNPAAVAVHEAKCIYPGVPIEILVSLGNGQIPSATELAVATLADTENEETSEETENESRRVKSVGWGDVFGSIVASATSTENVHHALLDLFPGKKYFRFNPVTSSTEIDETRPGKLRFFVEESQTYISNERERFEAAADILRPRRKQSLWERFTSAFQSEMKGFEDVLDGKVERKQEVDLIYPD